MRGFLASHPNIAIPEVGSNMWTYFYGQYGDLRRPENLESCLQAMLRYKHVRFLDPDPDRIRREFKEGNQTYASLFDLFLMHYAERRGKPRWGAQTGLIESYADHLFSSYPGVKVIHMVRDPRDRYQASLEKWPDGRGRAGGAVARWRYSLALAERNSRRYPDDYLVVRFESMVEDPEAVVRSVCAFIGEEFQPAMMDMGDAPKHRALLAEGSDPEAPDRLLSDRHVGRYRSSVSPAELAFIQLHAGRLMKTYGYAPEELKLPAGDWARFAVVDWPSQMARMFTWRAVEEVNQRFPAFFGRTPGKRMIIDEPVGVAL